MPKILPSELCSLFAAFGKLQNTSTKVNNHHSIPPSIVILAARKSKWINTIFIFHVGYSDWTWIWI